MYHKMQDLVDFLNLNKNQLPLDLNLFVTVRRNVVTVLGPVKKFKVPLYPFKVHENPHLMMS